jgi:mannitol/fructose-specific phosphotransferase system IIA component (Ntr-type)
MRLTQYLRPESIGLNITASSKSELIEKMLLLVAHHPMVRDITKVSKAVFEREHVMSTGMGKGCAVPHGKTDGIDEVVVAFGVTSDPVDFDSFDDEPVRFVLLIIRRECDTKLRLSLLARGSRILNSAPVREALLDANTPEEVIDIFIRAEDKIDTRHSAKRKEN